MKNSPHRTKHIKDKNNKKLNSTNVNLNESDEKRKKEIVSIYNSMIPIKDHLKQIDYKKTKEIFDYFIHHWQRECTVHLKHIHGSKRTSPNEVENDGSCETTPKSPKKIARKFEKGHLEKSKEIARQIVKHKNQHCKKIA